MKAYAVSRTSPTEHQLVAARSIAAGELIVAEKPIVQIAVGSYTLGTYAWDIVDRLLSDKSLLSQYTRCNLLASELLLDHQDLATEDFLVKKHRKSRKIVHDLYLGIGTNNIGIIDDQYYVRGHGVFPILSRSNHSCEPNTALTPANWREGEIALSAKRDIRAGEALTWCYFREAEFIPQDWRTRNFNLVNLYRFACQCPRCNAERPREIPSSQAAQLKYFDKLIVEHAREVMKTPEGIARMEAESPVNIHRNRLAERGIQ